MRKKKQLFGAALKAHEKKEKKKKKRGGGGTKRKKQIAEDLVTKMRGKGSEPPTQLRKFKKLKKHNKFDIVV